MKQWYEELFSNYAEKYEDESFTQGTVGEVNFIETEIEYDKNCRILDVGCGTGRHAIELAQRGYSVRGVDLSPNMLDKAREKARKAGVDVDFKVADARKLPFADEFDLVIMICEGAFPLMETDELNYKILECAVRALKKDSNHSKLIFTTLNGLFPLFHSVKDFINSNIRDGEASQNSFDLMTFREKSNFEVVDDVGKTKLLECDERYYVPSEITWLLKSLNFNEIDICGCKLGEFSRDDSLTTEDYEMLVIAKF